MPYQGTHIWRPNIFCINTTMKGCKFACHSNVRRGMFQNVKMPTIISTQAIAFSAEEQLRLLGSNLGWRNTLFPSTVSTSKLVSPALLHFSFLISYRSLVFGPWRPNSGPETCPQLWLYKSPTLCASLQFGVIVCHIYQWQNCQIGMDGWWIRGVKPMPLSLLQETLFFFSSSHVLILTGAAKADVAHFEKCLKKYDV